MPDEAVDLDRMPIGMFSRASGISVRTLRNYHDSGLLVPAVVDRWTGYRYYGVDQLADAMVIVRLRALDLPLAQVHEVLTRRDVEFTASVLEHHRATMEERLRETEQIVAALQSGISVATTPVHVQHAPASLAIAVTGRVAGAELWAWIEHASAHLLTVAGDRASGGPPGACYPQSIDDDDHEVVTAFVTIDEPFLVPASGHDVVLVDLPAVDVAVLSHSAGFDAIGEVYRLLGAWVARNRGTRDTEPVRELYHCFDPATLGDPTIEIHWPLAATPGSPIARSS